MIIPPSNRVKEIKPYYFATKLAEVAAMNAQGADVINLGIGSPDLLPPSEVIDTLKNSAIIEGANKYQPYRGIPQLRKAFADWYDTFFSVNLNPESEVLPLIGSKEGIMHIAMSFLQDGDEALVPNPGYPAYAMATKLSGARIVYYDLDDNNNWLPDLDRLSSTDLSNVKIMWLNYPHMPTGASATKEVFTQLISFAQKHNILLVHDNPYAFILNDNPLSVLSIKGAKEVAIELTSVSKSYNMAGWRVGALVGDASYIDMVVRYKSNMDSGMYRPIQEAAVVALNTSPEWLAAQNKIYASRRNIVWQIMEQLGCKYDKLASGLFVWGRIPDSIENANDMIDRILYDAKVFITPGHIFGANGNKYIRISLCASEEKLLSALDRIRKINDNN